MVLRKSAVPAKWAVEDRIIGEEVVQEEAPKRERQGVLTTCLKKGHEKQGEKK